MPESFWDKEKGFKSDDFNALLTRDAAEQSRRATLPTDPKAYKVELPGDFKIPEGVKFQIDQNNPLWDQGRAWAHKHGLSQEAFAEAIALVAGDRIGIQSQFETAARAELTKLGPTAAARLNSIQQFLTGHLGEQSAKGLMNRFLTAADVAAMEKLVGVFQRGGAQPFTTSGREPPDDGRVDEATWDKMSFGEKKEYAAKFPQQH